MTRRLLFRGVLLSILLILVSGTAHSAERNPHWAILIGINDYVSLADLQYCVNDQQALAGALQELDFPADQIVLLEDQAQESRYKPFKRNIEKQLELMLKLVRKGDVVLIAFSGHGVHFEKTSYICPADADFAQPAETLVSLDALYTRLEDCPAEFKLVLVDACRDDPRRPGKRTARSAADANRAFAEALTIPPRGVLL